MSVTGQLSRLDGVATSFDVVRALVVAVAGVLMLASCGLDSDSESAGNEGTLLFVQDADGATLNENSLTLTGVSEHTGWFSDRPERLAGQVATAGFVSLWDEGYNSFADDPPNADFTCQVKGETLNRVVELRSPKLDGKTLTYSTIGVDEVGATVISECDGNAHLFIDGGFNATHRVIMDVFPGLTEEKRTNKGAI